MINERASRSEQAFRHVPVGLLALGACSLAWNQLGSIYARDWLPYAVATGLLVAGLLWSGLAHRPARPALLGLAGLISLAAWDALSLLWSPAPSLARDEALLVAFYALVFLAPLVLLRRELDRRAATTILVALLVALGLASLVELLLVAHPSDYYESGRLTFPISYVNAQGALFFVGFWPAVALAADRAAAPAFRGLAIGGACVLLAGGLMTQSKGGVIASTLAGVVFFALSPGRLRAIVPALIPLALVAGSFGLLTRPFRQRYESGFTDAIRFASSTALTLAAVGVVVGCAYTLVDRRVSVSQRTQRLVRILLLAGLAVAAVTATVVFFVAVDRPGHFIDQKWQSFKTLPVRETGSSHLTSLGSNRYDFWRVDLRLAQDHPLQGVGARGFAQHYLTERRSGETPARGHSLELDTLAETGIVGLALLVAALGFPLARVIRRGRRSLLGAGLAAGVVYVLVHASADWISTFPAVGVSLFLLLGIASSGDEEAAAPPLIRGVLASVGAVLALALAIGAFALPWISARLTSAALRHSDQAAGSLRWAKRLDPLSVDPWLAQASLARRPSDAVEALSHAVDEEPDLSGLRYRLGLAYLRDGKRADARRQLAIAHRLDPRDVRVEKALQRVAG